MSEHSLSAGRGESRLIHLCIQYRWGVIALVAALLLGAAKLAGGLHKDTSSDAFTDPDSEALHYRRQVAEHFGLKDPIVIAVRKTGRDGVLDRDTLERLHTLSETLTALPNIDPERVSSLSTKRAIRGGVDGLEIEPLLHVNDESGSVDESSIADLTAGLERMPAYEGVLISKDRTTTIIAAELLNHDVADETYGAVTALAEKTFKGSTARVYVAGEGAVAGYLSTYLDHDARRMVPVAVVAIALILFCAFFTARGALLSIAVAVSTVLTTLGVMALMGSPYSAISNGMVVSLIGMSVADAIHVFSEYYDELEKHPELENRELVALAVGGVWKPMLLTSITTVGGFIALWATGDLVPIREFGIYGALGMAVAWIYTVTLLPALMACLNKKHSPLFSKWVQGVRERRKDRIRAGIVSLGASVLRRPWQLSVAAAAVIVVGTVLATKVRVEFARIDNFSADAPIRIADEVINRSMAGTYHLDTVIEVSDGDVLQPAVLRKIDAYQRYLRSLPQVGASVSIVDVIKPLNRAAEDDAPTAYDIPVDPETIAQLLVSYQASVPPTELQSLIDGAQKKALVRTYLHTKNWTDQHKAVEAAQTFLHREFTGDIRATLTGRVVVDDQTIGAIKSGHVSSIFASALMVLLSAMVVLRSVRDGFLCSVPVMFSIVFVYATMGAAGIGLSIATSMFASIAIGLGMDFGIHVVSRARQAERQSADVTAMVLSAYEATGRAAVFNAAAVAIGFGLVTISQVPPIRMFGLLVAIAIASTFLASLTVLPLLLKWLATWQQRRASVRSAISIGRLMSVVAFASIVSAVPQDVYASGEEDAEAVSVMQAVSQRNDGASADRIVKIDLIDRNGSIRSQTTRAIRKNFPAERRSAIFYLEPAAVRGTAFLAFDYADSRRADDQWLYLPALRKVRRIPASQRGDYFLGTDLTYDEIRNDSRVAIADWRFKSAGRDTVDAKTCTVIDGVAGDARVVKELGFSRARWCIDIESHIARRVEYWDRSGNALKTVFSRSITKIGAVWTALKIEVEHHKTGHRTLLEMKESKFDVPLPDSLFSQAQLERGL